VINRKTQRSYNHRFYNCIYCTINKKKLQPPILQLHLLHN